MTTYIIQSTKNNNLFLRLGKFFNGYLWSRFEQALEFDTPFEADKFAMEKLQNFDDYQIRSLRGGVMESGVIIGRPWPESPEGKELAAKYDKENIYTD